MRFIKRSAILLLLLNGLVACSQLPNMGGSEKRPEQEVSDPVDEAALDSETSAFFVAIPKPESARNVSVPSQARDEFSRAKQAMIRKNWKEAEEILLLMTSTYPKLSGVYTNLGIVYEAQSKEKKAENAYRYAIETNSFNFDAYTNLGVLLREQGKFAEAEKTYLLALELWPHHQASLINLGILYDMYLGRLNEALSQYELAQALNEQEDRTLKGWIIDLQRRLPKESGAALGSVQ